MLIFVMLLWMIHVRADVHWTPIFPSSQNQVDLWTVSESGCACDSGQCACCVPTGGCNCGRLLPKRCAQCGLERYCGNMCNMTINERWIQANSGHKYGHIQTSSSRTGPFYCFYRFEALPGHRIQIQIHRLVNTGSFNGTSCSGGSLEMVAQDGMGWGEICAEDARYFPPVVFYGDNGGGSLLFRVSENVTRSQFLAYFIFSSLGEDGYGQRQRGGHRIPGTECDWVFQDVSCRTPGSCVLTTPGYPGSYPANKVCRFLVTLASPDTSATIDVIKLQLPERHCRNTHVKVYMGPTTSSPVLVTLCGTLNRRISYQGPSLLIEFRSSTLVPPYNFSGMVTELEFRSVIGSNENSTRVRRPLRKGNDCEYAILGNETRGGHMDVGHIIFHPRCDLVFIGNPGDIIQISLINYKLSGMNCTSWAEFQELLENSRNSSKLIHRICGLSQRISRDPNGGFHSRDIITLNTRIAVLSVNLYMESDYLDIGYYFTHAPSEGVPKEGSICDRVVDGGDYGIIFNPTNTHLFWNLVGHVECTTQLNPPFGTGVLITLHNISDAREEHGCRSICVGDRCICKGRRNTSDHLLVLTNTGEELVCFCGKMAANRTLSVHSSSPLIFKQVIKSFTWAQEDLRFNVSFRFIRSICAPSSLKGRHGLIRLNRPQDNEIEKGHVIYYVECDWPLNTLPKDKLRLQLLGDIEGPSLAMTSSTPVSCPMFNITIWSRDSHSNAPLDVLCANGGGSTVDVQSRYRRILISLRSISQRPFDVSIAWQFISSSMSPDDGPRTSASTVPYSPTLLIILLFYALILSVRKETDLYFCCLLL